MSQILFFALKDDVLSVCELVESKGPLKYVLTGNFLKRKVKGGIPTFERGAAIRDLGKPAYESGGKSYLVYERNAPVGFETFRGIGGARVYVGDQSREPDTVEFTPGGLWKKDIVLQGRVATISDSPISRRLMRQFRGAIKKKFAKVQVFYVGPRALDLLKNGARLTAAEQCPREFDLALDDAAPVEKSAGAKPAGLQKEVPGCGVRLTYEESCAALQRCGYLESGDIPPMPRSRPRYDDEEPGVSFFRTSVGEDKLENLTLPRTFFGKPEIHSISFKNSDLSQSTLCWNDFDTVDFTDCDLSDGDLRASKFQRVKFVRAILRNADLRHSSFKNCDFTDAEMRGARLARSQGQQLRLSKKQREGIDWHSTAGDLPEGG